MEFKRETNKVMKFGSDYKNNCKIIFSEEGIDFIERTFNGKVSEKTKPLFDVIYASLRWFATECAKVQIAHSDIKLHFSNGIKAQIISSVIGGESCKYIDLAIRMKSSSNGIVKIINNLLNQKVDLLRKEYLIVEAQNRVTEDDEEIYEAFKASGLSFEDFVLSGQYKHLTVAGLQRLVLDCEILGKDKPENNQTKGFCLDGYLKSLDTTIPSYIIFENEKKLLMVMEQYSEQVEGAFKSCARIKSPFKGKNISDSELLKYYRTFYPKAYEAMMSKKTELKERRSQEDFIKATIGNDDFYREKGGCLNYFVEFFGDVKSFMKYYHLNEDEFNTLMKSAQIYVPSLYEKITEDINHYYEERAYEYMSHVMDIEYLYNQLDKRIFVDVESISTFLYEYYHMASIDLSEVLMFARRLVHKSSQGRIELDDELINLLTPAFSISPAIIEGVCLVKGKGKKIDKMFNITKYLKKNLIINMMPITEIEIGIVIEKLENADIPLYAVIVEEAIKRYAYGTLDDFIAGIPLNSDFMKKKLQKEEN